MNINLPLVITLFIMGILIFPESFGQGIAKIQYGYEKTLDDLRTGAARE